MKSLRLSSWCGALLLSAALCGPAAGCAPQAPAPSASPETPPPAAGTATEESPRYGRTFGSLGGIGKTYHGREIARVMGYEGADWLERPERGEEERPDLLLSILEDLGAVPGATVADVGAGSGYFTLPLARRLEPGGRVYAVDVQPEMIELLTGRAEEEGLTNVVPVLAAEDDPKLPPESVDLVFFVDVYHELAYPYEVMTRVVEALKPGGKVALVEYRGEDEELAIKPLHKMTEAQVRLEMEDLDLTYVETRDELPRQHVVVFRK